MNQNCEERQYSIKREQNEKALNGAFMASNPALFPELSRHFYEHYTTGVFPSQYIREFIQQGYIQTAAGAAKIEEGQIQPASLDLRLGPVAYQVSFSFLPGKFTSVETKLKTLKTRVLDLTKLTIFEKGHIYIVPLIEEIFLPRDVSAKANPRSTTGRLDIFTRVIFDFSTEFDKVPEGYKGKLYAEIVPHTFDIGVREGVKLNQIRFIRGNPPSSDSQLNELNEKDMLVYKKTKTSMKVQIRQGLLFSVNLHENEVSCVIGYKAKKNTPIIDFQKVNYYEPLDFWEPLKSSKNKNIILTPDEFHILASKEKIRVPPNFAAEMFAYDPFMGEYRVHYAGFFDPGFGYGLGDVKGTPAVLEVRPHKVPFLLEDGQLIGRLRYERLLALPDKIYGSSIRSSYQLQDLTLARQFKRLSEYNSQAAGETKETKVDNT